MFSVGIALEAGDEEDLKAAQKELQDAELRSGKLPQSRQVQARVNRAREALSEVERVIALSPEDRMIESKAKLRRQGYAVLRAAAQEEEADVALQEAQKNVDRIGFWKFLFPGDQEKKLEQELKDADTDSIRKAANSYFARRSADETRAGLKKLSIEAGVPRAVPSEAPVITAADANWLKAPTRFGGGARVAAIAPKAQLEVIGARAQGVADGAFGVAAGAVATGAVVAKGSMEVARHIPVPVHLATGGATLAVPAAVSAGAMATAAVVAVPSAAAGGIASGVAAFQRGTGLDTGIAERGAAEARARGPELEAALRERAKKSAVPDRSQVGTSSPVPPRAAQQASVVHRIVVQQATQGPVRPVSRGGAAAGSEGSRAPRAAARPAAKVGAPVATR